MDTSTDADRFQPHSWLRDNYKPSMLGKLFAVISLSSAALAVPTAEACTRDFLKAQAAKYVAAQAAGKPGDLTTGSVSYTEDFKTAALATGLLSKPLKIDFNRSTYDTTQCATYTEVIAASSTPPYVLGTQMRFTDGALSKMETIATTTGDWLFNAAGTLKYSQPEAWLVPTKPPWCMSLG